MIAAANLTMKQINAIVEKLGGETEALRFLNSVVQLVYRLIIQLEGVFSINLEASFEPKEFFENHSRRHGLCFHWEYERSRDEFLEKLIATKPTPAGTSCKVISYEVVSEDLTNHDELMSLLPEAHTFDEDLVWVAVAHLIMGQPYGREGRLSSYNLFFTPTRVIYLGWHEWRGWSVEICGRIPYTLKRGMRIHLPL